MTLDIRLRAPFPWFGGKSRASHLVWPRLGNVPNYVEPFAGSLAVLLKRPHEARVETVNDVDVYLANFWRALQAEPDHVAWWADYPVNEIDLHARHRWLVEDARERVIQTRLDPDFYDVQIAGWWVWGQCLWIGSGWCQIPHPDDLYGDAGRGAHLRNRPHLSSDLGVNSIARPRRQNEQVAKRPGLMYPHGKGVLAQRTAAARSGENTHLQQKKFRTGGDTGAVRRRFQGGGQAGGSGVHAPRLHNQKPALSGDGSSARGLDVAIIRSGGLREYLVHLSERLRRVRVCCGDWTRVLTPSVTTYMGVTGVLLDPPYAHDLRERCYAEDHDVSAAVRAWALEHGDDPKLRIALCGYEGEHDMPASWERVAWTAHGGYSRSARGRANRSLERIWFSPHCLRPSDRLPFETSEAFA